MILGGVKLPRKAKHHKELSSHPQEIACCHGNYLSSYGKEKKSTFFFSVKEERLESGEGKSGSTGNGTFPPRTGHIF